MKKTMEGPGRPWKAEEDHGGVRRMEEFSVSQFFYGESDLVFLELYTLWRGGYGKHL